MIDCPRGLAYLQVREASKGFTTAVALVDSRFALPYGVARCAGDLKGQLKTQKKVVNHRVKGT